MSETAKRRPLVIASLILAVLLALGALSFAGPCVHEDGSFAACHAASLAVIGSSVLAAVASLAALFVRGGKLAGSVMLVSAVAGLFAALSPGTLFGLCMMQTMRCWTLMRPFALVCGAALFLCALVAAIMLFVKNRGKAS